MNLIWEMALAFQEQGIEKQDVFFRQSETYSPYYEQAFNCMNEQQFTTRELKINAFYRFDNIFSELLSPTLKGYEEVKVYLFDILIHYLLEVDLRHGLSRREYYLRKIEKEVLKGCYGSKAQLNFQIFTPKERTILREYILYTFQSGTSVLLFSKIVKAIFPKGIIYKSNVSTKQILIYIGEKQSERQEKLIHFMKDTFLPLGFNVRLFWEYHFGILDVKETMELGDIEIL